MQEIIQEVIAGAVLLIVAGVGGYVVNFFRTRKNTIMENADKIHILEDDMDDIKRVFVMVAKKLDRGNKIAHPDIDSAFEELVKDLLTDEILGTNKCPI